jgi:hypothetical protein
MSVIMSGAGLQIARSGARCRVWARAMAFGSAYYSSAKRSEKTATPALPHVIDDELIPSTFPLVRGPRGTLRHDNEAISANGTHLHVVRCHRATISNRRTVVMTYQDPKIPDPGLGRNPPRYRDPTSARMSTFLGLAVGAAIILSALAYAFSDPSGTKVSNPPTTTGQGGAQISPSIAPRMAPAPVAPSTTVPPIDQNVPAEKIAPPIPSEPRTNN